LRRPTLWGNLLKTIPAFLLQEGILALAPDWARRLYGIEGQAMSRWLGRTATSVILAIARRSKSYNQVLSDTLAEAEAHPFARVK
jgi:hypothetical protein